MVHINQTGSNRHRNLAETVQSHPPASGSEHASTDARDSIRKWYIERGLYSYDVNANLVFKWLRDPRFNPPAEDGSTGPFLPVEVIVSQAVIKSPVLDVPVVEVPIIGSEAPGLKVEIVLPTGHRINVNGAYDPDALCRLVRGLA